MRVLIIEDDEDLANLISYALTEEHIVTDVCHEGDDGLRWLREEVHDLVLLDRMLPRMDGLTILKTIRAENNKTPVLMMTALGQIDERIEGLDHGADDYIVKPFSIKELLARVRAMGRRPREWGVSDDIKVGDLTLNTKHLHLVCAKNECTLSKRESSLLEMFLQNPNKVLARQTLLSRVWGPDADVEEGNLENYISFLRRRLRSLESTLKITTIRGVGYLLEVPNVTYT